MRAQVKVGKCLGVMWVALSLGWGACASGPKATLATPSEASPGCVAYVRDCKMDVVYAPGRVIANWVVVPSRFRDTSRASDYVRSLAKRMSGQLEMLYPSSEVTFHDDAHGASFSVSSDNIDELDAVRADLDGAAARFHQGACDNLLTGMQRGQPAGLAAAVSQNVSSP